jgi:signal transduction histidine kinase
MGPVLVVFLVSSAGVIGIGIFLTRRVSRPFQRLLLVARAVARGKYDSDAHTTHSTAEVRDAQHMWDPDAAKSISDMGKDELSQVYLALEEINRKLVQQQAELQSANQNLAFRNKQLADANEQLEALDRMKTDFINIAAHELKNPIQPLLGLSKLVRAGKIDNEYGWDLVERQSKMLRHLAESILDVSRIENGILTYDMKPLLISDPIRNVISSFAATSHVPIELEIEPSQQDLKILGDEKRFVQILTNLISNALRFTEQGRIVVTVQDGLKESNSDNDDGIIQIAIRDSGTGIPDDILPRLFGKFVTKPGSNGNGTGLGLFIAKSIIEAHKGTIRAENNTDDTGATFTIILPRLHEADISNPPKDAGVEAAPNTKSIPRS